VSIALREITDDNAEDVLALGVTAAQAQFVSSVAESLAEAAELPEAKPWFRAVCAEGRPVGFVMLSWDLRPIPPGFRGPWFLWKLLIDEGHQGRGYGREVVERVVALVREHGGQELLTSHGTGDGSPAGFYARLGFVPTGEVDDDGEVILRLLL
jgi:GNAT superfamily N-acetyltransferase